jgi:hypothetical protein
VLSVPAILGLLGCGVLYTSEHRVEAGVHTYLESRYGEPFVVTRVHNNSNAGAGFVDSHRFTAHPVADPSLSFTGTADYGADPPGFSDRYACVRVKRWAVDALLEAAPDAHLLLRSSVRCRPTLPVHPKPGEALPGGSLAVTLDLQVFAGPDPITALTASHTALLDRATALGIELDGSVAVFPEALFPFVSECVVPPVSPGLQLQRWDAMQQATMAFGASEPTTTPRDAALESEVRDAVTAVVSDARIAVWARPGYRGRTLVDIRIAAPGLDEDALLPVRTALDPLLTAHTWELRGIDTTGPAAEQVAAFVCYAGPIGCKPTTLPLLDPDWSEGPPPRCVTAP